jgi:hypothetical protein
VLVRFWLCLAFAAFLVAAPAGAAGAAGAVTGPPEAPAIVLEVTPFFSPNGDGVQDRAVVRFTLARASEEVTLRVLYRAFAIPKLRVVHLGPRQAGVHVWSWAGRRANGEHAEDGEYTVEVIAQYAAGPLSASRPVVLDTHFDSWTSAERYGARRSVPNKVYPRSTEVVDALPIRGVAEHFLKWAVLTIRDEDGRTVLRRDIKAGTPDDNLRWTVELAWRARRNGVALPVGRYRVFVAGADKAGNHGRSTALRIFVSADRLVWGAETRTLTAAETLVNTCTWSTANGCGFDYDCGELMSSRQFAGGISHRSAFCPPESAGYLSQARSTHLVAVPGVVRGIGSARVGFVGSPTYDGETDPGTLAIAGTTTASATTAQSPWIEGPPFGNGQPAGEHSPRLPPSVYWTFYTTGDDAFDVYTFTVDLRYLVVE